MKNKLFIFIFLLFLVLISSNLTFSQDLIKERPDLKEEITKLSEVLDFGEDELVNVEFIVYHFQGTVEEALVYVEETLLKNESKKIEMGYNENDLSEMLAGIRSLAEYGVIPPLEEEWIETSKVEEEKLKDTKQTAYYGYLEYPNLEKDINVESPYYNSVTFRLEEGTYIIYSESKLTEANNN